MPGDLSVRYLDISEYDLWDQFVDESRHGSIYNQSFFLDALCRVIGTQLRILAVFRQDELLGGMGIHFNASKYGDMVHIRPLLYYNGLVLKDFNTKYPSITSSKQTEIINTILNELEGGRYASAEIASLYTLDDLRALVWRGWRLWPRYTYVVPIHDLEQQWERAEQNIRRLISRCERDGMRLELSDDVETFYAMNKATYERKGVKPYLSLENFVTLYHALMKRDACQIYFAVSADGRPAAGQLVLMSKHPMTHTWMAGSDPEFLRTGASAFLRWKVFEDLNRRGYASNDLTDAMNDKVAKFKSQFGGDLKPAFVAYKEFSSRLRMRNRLYNNLLQPLNRLREKLMHKTKDEFTWSNE